MIVLRMSYSVMKHRSNLKPPEKVLQKERREIAKQALSQVVYMNLNTQLYYGREAQLLMRFGLYLQVWFCQNTPKSESWLFGERATVSLQLCEFWPEKTLGPRERLCHCSLAGTYYCVWMCACKFVNVLVTHSPKVCVAVLLFHCQTFNIWSDISIMLLCHTVLLTYVLPYLSKLWILGHTGRQQVLTTKDAVRAQSEFPNLPPS